MLELATQRTVLFWDTLRRRGNQFSEHELAGKPPVLHFDYELTVDDKQLEILERIKATLGQQAAA